MEKSLKQGYSIVFLAKKNFDIDAIGFKDIKEDMQNVFEKAKLMDLGIK